MTFSMRLDMSDRELELTKPVVSNFAKNLLCFNDIHSYEKELHVQAEWSLKCQEDGDSLGSEINEKGQWLREAVAVHYTDDSKWASRNNNSNGKGVGVDTHN